MAGNEGAKVALWGSSLCVLREGLVSVYISLLSLARDVGDDEDEDSAKKYDAAAENCSAGYVNLRESSSMCSATHAYTLRRAPTSASVRAEPECFEGLQLALSPFCLVLVAACVPLSSERRGGSEPAE